MTNINCSSECVYQNDGKCCLEKISKQKVTPDNVCAYFLSNAMLQNHFSIPPKKSCENSNIVRTNKK